MPPALDVKVTVMSLLCGAALVYTALPLLTTQVSLPGISLLY